MKSGKSMVELALAIERQRGGKRDFIADTRHLRMQPTDSGPALIVEARGYPLTPIAHQQLSERVGIPAKYYERLRTDAPELLARNVNHWFARQPERRLVRTLGGGARAFLSDRYQRIDNADVAEVTLPVLADKSRGREGGKATAAAEIRAAWERIANEALARAGHDARVDARTLADQGIDRAPGQHLGPAETRRLHAGKQRSPAETRTLHTAGADVRAELARKARELALAEMTALQEIAAIQEARKTTPAPAQVFADIGSITAWQHDALGMLARYWHAEDRAMELRRKMRASARRHAEMREATAEEQRALRSAGRRLSRSRALLQGVSEILLAMAPTLSVEIEPSDRPLTKQRLRTIRAALRERAREHEIGGDRW